MEQVNFADGADGPIAHPFHDVAAIFGSMPLVAHLRRDFVLAGGGHHGAHFPHAVRQGLLAVDVLPHFHGDNGSDGMSVIGGSNHHAVNLLVQFVQHDAPVVEALSLRVLLHDFRGDVSGGPLRLGSPVHITDGNNILAGKFAQSPGAVGADPDKSQIHFVAGGAPVPRGRERWYPEWLRLPGPRSQSEIPGAIHFCSPCLNSPSAVTIRLPAVGF